MMPMNYREAVMLIRKNGGEFLKHGSRHDLFVMPNGTTVPVPRHPGDFSRYVEDDIKKRATGARR